MYITSYRENNGKEKIRVNERKMTDKYSMCSKIERQTNQAGRQTNLLIVATKKTLLIQTFESNKKKMTRNWKDIKDTIRMITRNKVRKRNRKNEREIERKRVRERATYRGRD